LRDDERVPRVAETALLTLLALQAFAANSILTRLALGAGHIDPASFTALRLASGAAVLAALARARSRTWISLAWPGALGPLALLAYAAPFSFAYLRIGAALGALVLFGSVQITVLGLNLVRGERPPGLAWLGSALALGGLGGLLLPSAARPAPWESP
jgi:drug/metabolite transporter (DMT)-like permease